MSPTSPSIKWTTRDLEVLPQQVGNCYELIDGSLYVTRSPHRKHQQTVLKIAKALDDWCETSGLGQTLLSPAIFLTGTDNVVPDIVWVSNNRLAQIENDTGHLTGVPELVVEVLAPGETNIRRDREAKLKLYSIQGTREYWIADRFSQRIEIYRRRGAQLTLIATLLPEDTLNSPLLSDFSHPVASLFV